MLDRISSARVHRPTFSELFAAADKQYDKVIVSGNVKISWLHTVNIRGRNFTGKSSVITAGAVLALARWGANVGGTIPAGGRRGHDMQLNKGYFW